jgi:hypothetical protein
MARLAISNAESGAKLIIWKPGGASRPTRRMATSRQSLAVQDRTGIARWIHHREVNALSPPSRFWVGHLRAAGQAFAPSSSLASIARLLQGHRRFRPADRQYRQPKYRAAYPTNQRPCSATSPNLSADNPNEVASFAWEIRTMDCG